MLGLSKRLKKLFGASEEMQNEMYQPNWTNVDSSKQPLTREERDQLNMEARKKDNPDEFKPKDTQFKVHFILGGNKPGVGGAGGSGRVTSR